jgi:hypothetical protein
MKELNTLFRMSRILWPILAGVMAAGCGSSSQLVDVWRDPSYEGPGFSNVLVMAMMRDPVRRRLWEDQLAGELEKHGGRATPSYQLFPESLPDSTRAIETVRRRGFDGVLFTTMLPTETSTRHVPGYVETVPVTRYSWWANAYYTSYAHLYQPGYTETQRVTRLRTGRLVWSGTTEVMDPSSAQEVRNQVADRIVPELSKQGIVQRAR